MEKDDIELFEVRGINRTSRMGRVSYDAHLQALAQRQVEGRYTLEEAAMTLAQYAGERADEMLEGLIEAVGNRVLPVHEPRHSARRKADQVREWHDEATWRNLNAWLAVYHPEITWQFPAPTSQKVGTDEAASETPQERKDRLRKRCDELKLQKVKAWKAQVAGEEGISPQRLHTLINDKKPKSKKASAPDWFK